MRQALNKETAFKTDFTEEEYTKLAHATRGLSGRTIVEKIVVNVVEQWKFSIKQHRDECHPDTNKELPSPCCTNSPPIKITVSQFESVIKKTKEPAFDLEGYEKYAKEQGLETRKPEEQEHSNSRGSKSIGTQTEFENETTSLKKDNSPVDVVVTGTSNANNDTTSCQVDEDTPLKSRVRIMSGNYSDRSNGSNGKGKLVRTTPCKAIVLLEGTGQEVALNFASVELDFESADNRAPQSGETKTTELSRKGQKAEPRLSSPEELAYFTKWNNTYGKKLNETEHKKKVWPKIKQNVNQPGFHLRRSFIFKGHENSFLEWYKKELESKGKSLETLPRQQQRGLMGRWGAFMEKLYEPVHNYSGQYYFLYFEFKK